MDLKDLVHALLGFNALTARQWIAEARHSGFVWTEVTRSCGLDVTELATAAGEAELLAERTEQSLPGWAAGIPPAPERLFLVRAASSMRACGLSASAKTPNRSDAAVSWLRRSSSVSRRRSRRAGG